MATDGESKASEVPRTRSVFWQDDELKLIDQPALPTEFRIKGFNSAEAVAEAIKTMVVRGAPAIGAAGAFGMAIAARAVAADASFDEMKKVLQDAGILLDAARPTAVNLSWAIKRMNDFAGVLMESGTATISSVQEALLAEAQALADADVEINKRMGRHGAEVVKPGANILHHCNTGALATVDIGTAIGVIYECHAQGKGIHVWVDETRPRLQGARLSAWELMREGVPMHLIADNAAGHLMATGKVDVVLYGADRVAANGDVANKIGTYSLSVVANENGVAVYAVVPTSTIDLDCLSGKDIPIEERGEEEVTTIRGVRIAPEGCKVFNPAFDVTPAKYLTGIITEEGIAYPPFEISLRRAKEAAEKRIKEEWDARA